MKKFLVLMSFIALLSYTQADITAARRGGIVFGFDGLSNNEVVNTAIGEDQLAVEVSDEGSGKIRFSFYNEGTQDAVIAEIYFDDNSNGSGDVLEAIDSIEDNPPSVIFTDEDVKPPNLPAGQEAIPPFVQDFSIGAENPSPAKGVSPGEEVGVIFTLKAGVDFADAIAAILGQNLRIGLHVQAIGDSGNSESFLSTEPGGDPVPEANTLVFASLFMGMLMIRKKKTA